jgi:hypothetical protein
VSLVGGSAGDLGVLLGLRGVLVALHVVVLAVMVGGGAMRLGCALVVIGRFCVGLAGHLCLPFGRGISGRSLAASIVFAASAFVVFKERNWLSRQFIGAEKYHLAKQTLLEHNAVMTDSAVFKTDVVKDVGNPNRFRWNIYENQRVRDKSFYSFATRREAQNDADKFVRKLDSVWPGPKE